MTNRKLKILIVEDEALIAKDIETSLRQLGYNIVGIAYDPTKALDMIATRNPDLILLDIELNSNMTGIDIANILNDKFQIPFIYLTSYADPGTIDQVKTTLPFGYILKPFSEKDLYSAIELACYRLQKKAKNTFPEQKTINTICLEPLSIREYEILNALFKGKSNLEISQQLYISLNTVKTHLKNIYLKMGVSNRHAVFYKIFELMK